MDPFYLKKSMFEQLKFSVKSSRRWFSIQILNYKMEAKIFKMYFRVTKNTFPCFLLQKNRILKYFIFHRLLLYRNRMLEKNFCSGFGSNFSDMFQISQNILWTNIIRKYDLEKSGREIKADQKLKKTEIDFFYWSAVSTRKFWESQF